MSVETRRFCVVCGRPRDPGTAFCAACGTPHEGAPAAATPGAVTPPVGVTPPVVAPPPVIAPVAPVAWGSGASAAVEPRPALSDELRLGAILGFVAALLTLISIVVPNVAYGEDATSITTLPLLSGDWSSLAWFALELLVVTVVLATCSALIFARLIRRFLAAGLMIGVGLTTVSYWIGQVLYTSDPTVGGRLELGTYVGVASGGLAIIAGVLVYTAPRRT